MTNRTTFPAKKITQLRRRAEKAAKLPKNVPSGWSKSKVDPMGVLAVFKTLRIKDGYILRAYQFHEGGNGNGFVSAVPVDADFPDPEECPRLKDVFLEPPKPPLALDDYMDAIDGDSKPLSYLSTSILARELAEFGAMWHGCDWDTHMILDAEPWKDAQDGEEDGVTPESAWEWLQPRPIEWKPHVEQDGDRVTVTFLTYSQLGGEVIYRNIDVYSAGSYMFKADRQEIAKGGGGFVF